MAIATVECSCIFFLIEAGTCNGITPTVEAVVGADPEDRVVHVTARERQTTRTGLAQETTERARRAAHGLHGEKHPVDSDLVTADTATAEDHQGDLLKRE